MRSKRKPYKLHKEWPCPGLNPGPPDWEAIWDGSRCLKFLILEVLWLSLASVLHLCFTLLPDKNPHNAYLYIMSSFSCVACGENVC